MYGPCAPRGRRRLRLSCGVDVRLRDRRPDGSTAPGNRPVWPPSRRRDWHGRHSLRAMRLGRPADAAPVARGPSASGGRGGPSRPSRHPRSTPAVHPRPTLGRHPAPGTARCVHRLARVPCPAPTAQSVPAAVLSGCAARAAGVAQRLSHGLGVGPGHRTPRSPPCHRRPCLVPGTHRQVHTGGSPLGVCRSSGRRSPAPLARARRRPRAPHAAFTALSPSAVPRARHSPPSPHRRQSSRGVPLERPA